MRFLTRLHALSAVAIFTILSFGWILPSLHIQTRIQKAWKGSARQLVVFGDDWSDIGEYRISPPKAAAMRDEAQGQLWTEVLCKELVCDYIDNFARSSIPGDNSSMGSLIDNDIYANATSSNETSPNLVADFKTQVQQWINFEKQKRGMPRRHRKDEWTIFTVQFGVWDLLRYASLERKQATFAIDRSIEELFHGLNTIAEHKEEPIKVVLPLLFDVTFLPRFASLKDSKSKDFAQDQHLAVFLLGYWNSVLSRAATHWAGGEIVMPDVNRILVGEVRAKQLYTMGITDASGAGTQTPLFAEVETPCLSLPKSGDSAQELQGALRQICTDPAGHLFWDDMHLGGTAHVLIGENAALLINGNDTVNAQALEPDKHAENQGSVIQSLRKKPRLDFKLKFPPT